MFTKRDGNLEKQEPLWHEETVADVDNARERMSSFGPNRLEASGRPSNLKIFLSQFNDFMIWVLLVAALVSGFILKELTDAIAITAILILNALLGFRQEVVVIDG